MHPQGLPSLGFHRDSQLQFAEIRVTWKLICSSTPGGRVGSTMALLTCGHCQRVNAAEARYCYHDGASLVGAVGPTSRQPSFPSPFVFPSGRPCRNFDELVLACSQEWESAADMLAKGFFHQFF